MLNKFIGIPFKNRQSSFDQCDCFGLVRLVYKETQGKIIKQPQSSAFHSRLIEEEYLAEISKNWKEVKDPLNGDVVAMAHDPLLPNVVQHFGIFLGGGKMLHTLRGVGSHVCRLNVYTYCIKGYYRYG